jgi:hypothetical protein
MKYSLTINNIILSIFITMILAGCSPRQPKPIEPKIDEPPLAPSAEAVYLYGEGSAASPNEIILNLNDEPLFLGQGFVRLAGVVEGVGGIKALIDDKGRGVTLGLGDGFHGYRLKAISSNSVLLKKEREALK